MTNGCSPFALDDFNGRFVFYEPVGFFGAEYLFIEDKEKKKKWLENNLLKTIRGCENKGEFFVWGGRIVYSMQERKKGYWIFD